VGAGDGPDNGEAKPVPVSVADPLAAKLLEWLEQPAHLVGRDKYAGVADRDHRPPRGPGRRDLHPATHWTRVGTATLTGLAATVQAGLFPIIAAVVSEPQWHRLLEQVGPMSAGLAIQATTGLRSLPIGPWAGLGVLAAWAFVALLAAGCGWRSATRSGRPDAAET
jgi:hypothetical protein